jgi:hypothetical protein
LLNVGMLYLALLLLAMMLLSAAMPLLGIQLIARRVRRSCPGWKARSAVHAAQRSADVSAQPVLLVCAGAGGAEWLGPWQALRDSFRGGMANWQAVLLSAFMLAVLLFLALLPLGLGLLLWFPVLYVTAYTGWKDLFAPRAD